MVGPGSTQLIPDHQDCHFPPEPLTLGDVLRPYRKYPWMLLRLAAWALPEHFTVHYFEVLPEHTYFRPSNGANYHNGSVLMSASDIREAIVTRFWMWIVAAGILLGVFSRQMSSELRGLILFLALWVPSQIAMCLIGEGVRDLSKHLAGAQLCLDLLSVLCLMSLCIYLLRVAGLERHAAFAADAT